MALFQDCLVAVWWRTVTYIMRPHRHDFLAENIIWSFKATPACSIIFVCPYLVTCPLVQSPIYQLSAITWQCWCPSSDSAGGSPCPGWCSLPGACNTHTPELNIFKGWLLVLYLMDPCCFPAIRLRSKIKDFTYMHLQLPVHSICKQTGQSKDSLLLQLRQRGTASWTMRSCGEQIVKESLKYLNTVKAWKAESL